MPRDLFGNVTRPSISIGNRKWYTLPLSLFSHSAIVAILIALPILAPSVMPSVFADNDVDCPDRRRSRLLPPKHCAISPPPHPTQSKSPDGARRQPEASMTGVYRVIGQ
jgi:hypothetical protein